VKFLTDTTISTHGILHLSDSEEPSGIPSLLRSMCSTRVLPFTMVHKRDAGFEYVHNMPQKLHELYGAPRDFPLHPDKIKSDSNVVSKPAKDQRNGISSKGPTPNQAMHPDDRDKYANRTPRFCSALTAISDGVFIRHWDYSHDLSEMVNVLENLARNQMHKEDEHYEDIIGRQLKESALQGSLVQSGELLSPVTVAVDRGESEIFLSDALHGGACLQEGNTEIIYRLHVYLVRPGLTMDPNSAYVCHSGVSKLCSDGLGGDYKL
jgi:hypothetical protein